MVSQPIRAMIPLRSSASRGWSSQAGVDAALGCAGAQRGPVSSGAQCHGAQCPRGPVSDFVFGFSADPGHDISSETTPQVVHGAQCQTLFLVSQPIRAMIPEIIRKSRVASQAGVDARVRLGTLSARLRPSMGASSCSAISQCWRRARRRPLERCADRRDASEPNGPGRSDHKPPRGWPPDLLRPVDEHPEAVDQTGQARPAPAAERRTAASLAPSHRRPGGTAREEDSSDLPPRVPAGTALNRFHRARHARPTAGPLGHPGQAVGRLGANRQRIANV